MNTALILIHIVVAVGIIGLVLLQQGKGADMGAAFGSGASSTVFGARGSSNFLSRTTAILATAFFITSLTLAYFSGKVEGPSSVVERVQLESDSPAIPETPAVPEQGKASGDVPVVPQGNSTSELPPE